MSDHVKEMIRQAQLEGARHKLALGIVFAAKYGRPFDARNRLHQAFARDSDLLAAVERRFRLMFDDDAEEAAPPTGGGWLRL